MCPHSNLTLRYKQNRASSISECNVGGRPDGKRMNGESSYGFSRNQRVVYFTKTEKPLVAVLSSMSTKNSCSRTCRVPRDVQHCGVMLVFVYRTD